MKNKNIIKQAASLLAMLALTLTFVVPLTEAEAGRFRFFGGNGKVVKGLGKGVAAIGKGGEAVVKGVRNGGKAVANADWSHLNLWEKEPAVPSTSHCRSDYTIWQQFYSNTDNASWRAYDKLSPLCKDWFGPGPIYVAPTNKQNTYGASSALALWYYRTYGIWK